LIPVSADPTPSDARQYGIGERLQAARERTDLSVVQAAELLHVDPGVIHALETERFGDLGAPVYVRGHLRHYAELLKESAPELLGLYGASVQSGPPPDLTLMPHARQNSSWRSALVTTGVAVVIGVGLIGSVRWIYLDLHPASAALPAVIVASAPAPPAPSPALEAPTVPAPAPTSVASSPVSAIPAGVTHTIQKPVPPPVVKTVRSPRTPPALASVTLKFRSACWTEVYDAHGEQLYHAIGAAGTVETLRGAAPLKVTVGNFAQVSIEIDGQSHDIPAEAQSGAAAEFLVTQQGELQATRNVTTAGNKP
jgi:cytoskeleton protein RodZ